MRVLPPLCPNDRNLLWRIGKQGIQDSVGDIVNRRGIESNEDMSRKHETTSLASPDAEGINIACRCHSMRFLK